MRVPNVSAVCPCSLASAALRRCRSCSSPEGFHRCLMNARGMQQRNAPSPAHHPYTCNTCPQRRNRRQPTRVSAKHCGPRAENDPESNLSTPRRSQTKGANSTTQGMAVRRTNTSHRRFRRRGSPRVGRSQPQIFSPPDPSNKAHSDSCREGLWY